MFHSLQRLMYRKEFCRLQHTSYFTTFMRTMPCILDLHSSETISAAMTSLSNHSSVHHTPVTAAHPSAPNFDPFGFISHGGTHNPDCAGKYII